MKSKVLLKYKETLLIVWVTMEECVHGITNRQQCNHQRAVWCHAYICVIEFSVAYRWELIVHVSWMFPLASVNEISKWGLTKKKINGV